MSFGKAFVFDRRTVLGGLAGFLSIAATGMPQAAKAAIKLLTIIIPSSPGGGYDQTARSVQSALQSNKLFDAIQVENVPAGGGIVGINTILNMPGDASTILQGGLATIVTSLTSQTKVDINKLTPLARLTSEYQVIAVPAASELKTVADLVAKMKADPSSVSWAGGPAGSHDHVSVGLVAAAIGIDPKAINYVPYRGASISMALLGNQVTTAVSGVSEFEEHVAAGNIRILAIMSPKRVEGVDAPTLVESGVDVLFANWRGLFGAPELAKQDYDQLLGALTAMEKTDAWQGILKTKRWGDSFMPGPEFGDFYKSEQDRLTKMLVAIGILG